jgi:hypothetical protein
VRALGFELEVAGAGPGDIRILDAVAHQEVAGMPGLVESELKGVGCILDWEIPT